MYHIIQEAYLLELKQIEQLPLETKKHHMELLEGEAIQFILEDDLMELIPIITMINYHFLVQFKK